MLVKKFISPPPVAIYLKLIALVVVLENVIPPLFELTNTKLPLPNDLKLIVPDVVEFSKLKLPDLLKKLKFPLPPASRSMRDSIPDCPIRNVPAVATPVVEFVAVIYEVVAFGL